MEKFFNDFGGVQIFAVFKSNLVFVPAAWCKEIFGKKELNIDNVEATL